MDLNLESVARWLDGRTDVGQLVDAELIEGGRSNLTYKLTDDQGRRWVLRRPPLHGVLDSAHDMERESRVMVALRDSDVPVPPVVGYEDDSSIVGAPFYVMDFVDGHVVRDEHDAAKLLDRGARHRAADELVDVLARIHLTRPEEVGLGDIGRRSDYLKRQLHRWQRQLHGSGGRNLALLDDVHTRLLATAPPQRRTGIVHGDYRLENAIVGGDGRLRAVLDWELCTLGDPLADVGLLLVYWVEPDDEAIPMLARSTAVEGFFSRGELIERYERAAGMRMFSPSWYVGFAYWRLACIVEGVYARYKSGAMGQSSVDGETMAQMSDALTARADDWSADLGV